MSKGCLYALLTALCWSTSGLFVKYIHQSAFVIAGATALIALLFNCVFVHEKMQLNLFTIIVGICQFLMHISFVFANQLTSVGNAIVLQYSSMIFVLIYEAIDKRRLPMRYQYLVILMAIVGMIVFFLDSFSSKGMLGNMLAIISGAFFGLQFYLNTKKKAHPKTSINVQYVLAIIVMILSIVINKGVSFKMQDITFICMSGIFQTALSGIFFAQCIVCLPAFTANVICMSEIIMAPLWAFIFLNESFTTFSFIGALIIVSALVFNIYMEYQNKIKGQKGDVF